MEEETEGESGGLKQGFNAARRELGTDLLWYLFGVSFCAVPISAISHCSL